MSDLTIVLALLPVLIIQFGLMIFALVDLIRNPRTVGPKWLWGIIIVIGNIIGPVLYFIFGRRNY
ncbi:PLDc N-terminal domain-containing protein [Indiicoccus explosivorum]|uniref:PLDc N-terminal domain-containing protein n=1 Tax=Indiicoccus explosivorum TaxID=1917864 RepID=UPI000B454B10|nr:PLDc N-terminal domain-containing protein [Indiicoccus explosivorum]